MYHYVLLLIAFQFSSLSYYYGDCWSIFNRSPGDCEIRTSKDTTKPQVKKSEIGTTTISSYKSPQQNSLGMLKLINQIDMVFSFSSED